MTWLDWWRTNRENVAVDLPANAGGAVYRWLKREDALRREGAVAALVMLADQCWHDQDAVLRLKSRIEAGEVTPWG